MKKKFKALSKTKKRLVVICPLAAVVIVLSLWFAFKPDPAPSVNIAQIEVGSIQSVIETSGTVSTDNSTVFSLPEGTGVNEVFVSVGSVVEPGQLLATFDTAPLMAQLGEKQSQYSLALKAYNDYATAVKEAKQNLPAVNAQVVELEAEVARLQKIVDDNKAAAASTTTTAKPSTTTTTAKPSSDDSLLDELSTLLANLIDIRGTISDMNAMFESFNSMNSTSFDMASLMSASTNTPETELIQAQISLLQANAEQTTMSATAGGELEPMYKYVRDSAKMAADKLSADIDKLNAGWYSDFKGVVTQLNILPASIYTSGSSSASQSVDVSTIISAISGGSADLSGLMSAFLGSSSGSNTALTVENYDGYVATFSLDKYNFQQVSVGQQVKVSSVNDNSFYGEVIYVSASATESSALDIASLASSFTGGSGSSATALGKVKIFDPNGTVVTGFDVDLEIVTAVVENIPVVPVEAVRYDDGGMYVWIYNSSNKTVRKSYVTFGVSEDTKYELLTGAALGDTIIINPPSSLEEGAKVSVITNN